MTARGAPARRRWPGRAGRVGPAGRAGEVGSGDTAPAGTRPAARGSQAQLWGLLLIAGWLAQAGLRAWLSRMQVVPLATPDESDSGPRGARGEASPTLSRSPLMPVPELIVPT